MHTGGLTNVGAQATATAGLGDESFDASLAASAKVGSAFDTPVVVGSLLAGIEVRGQHTLTDSNLLGASVALMGGAAFAPDRAGLLQLRAGPVWSNGKHGLSFRIEGMAGVELGGRTTPRFSGGVALTVGWSEFERIRFAGYNFPP